MNQLAKTISFLGVAAAAVVLALATRPSVSNSDPQDMRGKQLVDDFDPTTAASLEIVEFDEDTATVRPFQVAQVPSKAGKVRWSIPSHDDYPADAQDQVAQAATSLLGLKIVGVEKGDSPSDHQLYGVVDPLSKDLQVGSTGVGMRVTMKNKGGKELVSLIIGKPASGGQDLRYVRRAKDDTIYVVAAKTDKLSTKFGDWIEKNLLKMSTWDMKQVQIRDYSVDILHGLVQQNGRLTLKFDDTADPKWKLTQDEKFVADDKSPDGGRWTPGKLATDEELNTTRLDEMKTALDDLKIVDVRRKPAGLKDDLKADKDFMSHPEAINSLGNFGFYIPRDSTEIFSNDGEVRYLMKDGVQYVLRFGNVATDSTTGKKDKDKKKEADTGGANRYLFVMAEFNPDAIPQPVLEPLPEEAKKSDAKPADAKKADAKKADAKPAPGDKKDAKAGDKKDEKKPDEKKIDVKAERQRIVKENKRKQEEYDGKVAAGKQHVKELNERFAEWYYVIADDVHAKIHLTREQIVKKKDKAKDADHDHDHAHEHAAGEEKSNPLTDLDKLKSEGPAAK